MDLLDFRSQNLISHIGSGMPLNLPVKAFWYKSPITEQYPGNNQPEEGIRVIAVIKKQ